MKALNADPAFKAQAAARMKALNADPAFKAQAAARMKALNADPAFKARMKALHADPAFKARMKALHAGLNIAMPRWVTADLVDDFLDLAALFGEEAAASFVRRLKREAACAPPAKTWK